MGAPSLFLYLRSGRDCPGFQGFIQRPAVAIPYPFQRPLFGVVVMALFFCPRLGI